MKQNYQTPPLCEIFNSKHSARVLLHTIAHRDSDYSISEMADMLGISRQTVSRTLKPLIRYGLVTESRIVDKTRMYSFNPSLKTSISLLKFNDAIIDYLIKNFEIESPKPTGVFVQDCEICKQPWAVDLEETARQAKKGQFIQCPNCHFMGVKAEDVIRQALRRSIARGIYQEKPNDDTNTG